MKSAGVLKTAGSLRVLRLIQDDVGSFLFCCPQLSASLDALVFSSRVFPTFERLFKGQSSAQKDSDLSIRVAAVASLYDIARVRSLLSPSWFR